MHRVQMSAGPVCKGPVPEVSLDEARKSEGIREKEWGSRVLQTANDQKDRCPQEHQARRLGAPFGFTQGCQELSGGE